MFAICGRTVSSLVVAVTHCPVRSAETRAPCPIERSCVFAAAARGLDVRDDDVHLGFFPVAHVVDEAHLFTEIVREHTSQSRNLGTQSCVPACADTGPGSAIAIAWGSFRACSHRWTL